jgi:hypothetical protein
MPRSVNFAFAPGLSFRLRNLTVLPNPIENGCIVWNRSCEVRDPKTRRRVMRTRPMDELT